MPIDANILLQQQPIQLSNPLAQAGQIAQIQGAQNQNRLAQLQYDQAQRGVDQENKFNALYQSPGVVNSDGTVNRGALFTGAAQGGFGSRIPDLQKKFADADKALADVDETRAKAKKTGFEAANLALTQGRDMLNTVNDVASGRQWITAQYANPDTAAIFNKFGPLDTALQRYDQQTATPEGFAKWKQGASLTAEQLVKFTTPDANTVANNNTSRLNNQETNATSRANNNATVGATIRGQNMTDARTREQIAQGKVPSGYRQNPDGSLSAIPGGPAEKDKSLTETQGKATGFAARMQDANKIISQFDGKVNPSAVAAVGGVAPDWLPGGGALNAAANYTVGKMSPEAQLYQQAQENWLTANLRLESGAVIGDKEKENEAKKWFPQPGDTPARIAQKAEARKVAEKSMLVQAGPGAKQVGGIVTSASPAPAAGVPADIGDLLNKYGK